MLLIKTDMTEVLECEMTKIAITNVKLKNATENRFIAIFMESVMKIKLQLFALWTHSMILSVEIFLRK